MNAPVSRRGLLGAGLTLPLFALPGCVQGLLGEYDFDAAVRRLLDSASRRAMAGLMRPSGFYADRIAQVTLPDALGGSGAVASQPEFLQRPEVQAGLLRAINDAGSEAAAVAPPLIRSSILAMRMYDPVAIIRGGPNAATDYLHRSMGNRLYEAIFPYVGNALRRRDPQLVTQALQAAPGFGFAALQRDVAYKASEGIYRAIAREEAAIRVNPSLSGDRYLMKIYRPIRRPRDIRQD